MVLIETKNGRAGQATMEYDTYVAAGTAPRQLGFLSGDENRAIVHSLVNLGRLTASRLASLGTANTNWERETERTSLSQNHNVSFAGGNQTTTFRASPNYADQQGVVISNGFTRLQARRNGNHEALDGTLRVGYGLQGNLAVPPYASLAPLAADNQARYVFGNTIYTGVVPTVNANPDLKWEQSAQSNIAFDFGFMDARFSGSLENYSTKTTDLLLTVPVSQTGSSFVSTQLRNIGSLRNRGVEASLDARLYECANTGVKLTAGLVFSPERNKVLDLGKADYIETAYLFGSSPQSGHAARIVPGQPIGTFYGPQFVGFNATGQQTFTKFTVTRDVNGTETGRAADGVTTSPGGDDKIVIGNANPDFSLGLRSNATWKRCDASWLWRLEQGRDVFNYTALVYGTKSNVLSDRNFLRSALSSPESVSEPSIFSSRYVEDG